MNTSNLTRDILRLIIGYIECPQTLLNYTGTCRGLREYFLRHHMIRLKRGDIKWKTCSGEKHLIKTWHYNGQLHNIYNYENGKKEGIQLWWYSNGQLKHKEKYKNGKYEGIQHGWFSNGQLRYENNYSNGILIP